MATSTMKRLGYPVSLEAYTPTTIYTVGGGIAATLRSLRLTNTNKHRLTPTPPLYSPQTRGTVIQQICVVDGTAYFVCSYYSGSLQYTIYRFRDGIFTEVKSGASDVIRGIAVDSSETYCYYSRDHGIYRITLSSLPSAGTLVYGNATTTGTTDANGTSARFNTPGHLAITSNDATLYVADTTNNRLRAINLSTTAVTTIAGDGTAADTNGNGTGAQVNAPIGLCINSDDTILYFTTAGHRVRKYTISSTAVAHVAGSGSSGSADGTGTGATFATPGSICCDSTAGYLYVTQSNTRFRQVKISDTVVTTLWCGSSRLSALATITANGYAEGFDGDCGLSAPRGAAVWTTGVIVIHGDAGTAFVDVEAARVYFLGTEAAGDDSVSADNDFYALSPLVDVYIVPSGGTREGANAWQVDLSVASGETEEWNGWEGLETGDTIEVVSRVPGISIAAFGMEVA